MQLQISSLYLPTKYVCSKVFNGNSYLSNLPAGFETHQWALMVSQVPVSKFGLVCGKIG
jgi:hypothetical protein